MIVQEANGKTSAEQRKLLRSAIGAAIERKDAAALASALSELAENGVQSDYTFAAARLKALSAEEAEELKLRPLRVFIARSITVEPLLPNLVVHGARNGLRIEYEVGGYGSFIEEMMSSDAALARFQPDAVLFLADLEDIGGGLEDACASADEQRIAEEVRQTSARIESLIQSLRSHSKARFVFQGFVRPDHPVLGEVADPNVAFGESQAISQINATAAVACRKAGDAVFFDQDQLAARHGRERWRDHRMFRAARLSVSAEFFNAFSRGLARSLRALVCAPSKVLCTDLDNTLWGGIVGEDGPEGIATGASFPGNCFLDYQKFLKRLSARGILLSIASKNNEEDVKEAFAKRSQDMALSLGDFVGVKIGWDEKANSLRALAKELSLGLDSFVFVDDNPVECAAIRLQLPEVKVVEISPDEPWTIVPKIQALGAFDTFVVTDDDRQRNAEYKAQARRATLEQNSGSREDFLASLQIVCEVGDALQAPLSRTVQLLNKTNQFNLTTRRHAASDVERIAAAPGGQAVALRAKDRFGDAGVVGIALCVMNGSRCYVDSFLLSCRVIGRGIETALLWFLAQKARESGATHMVGEYIPTAKNQMCAEFYTSHGFTAVSDPQDVSKGKLYDLELSTEKLQKPHWIEIRS